MSHAACLATHTVHVKKQCQVEENQEIVENENRSLIYQLKFITLKVFRSIINILHLSPNNRLDNFIFSIHQTGITTKRIREIRVTQYPRHRTNYPT